MIELGWVPQAGPIITIIKYHPKNKRCKRMLTKDKGRQKFSKMTRRKSQRLKRRLLKA